VDARTSRPAG